MHDVVAGYVDATTKRLAMEDQSDDYYEGYDEGLRTWFFALKTVLATVRFPSTQKSRPSTCTNVYNFQTLVQGE